MFFILCQLFTNKGTVSYSGEINALKIPKIGGLNGQKSLKNS